MSTVEIETGTYIKRFAFWNPATWSIPKLYWDAWSVEQRTHAICRQLEKVLKYADYLGVNTDDIAARLKAIEDGQLDPVIEAAIEEWFEENEPAVLARITELESALPSTVFTSENTVEDAITELNDALPLAEFDTENTVKDAIDNLNAMVNGKIVVAVEQYGAVGDGITDCTEAIQTAIDENPNSEIYFIGGVYCISSTIFVDGDINGVVINLNGSTIKWIGSDNSNWSEGNATSLIADHDGITAYPNVMFAIERREPASETTKGTQAIIQNGTFDCDYKAAIAIQSVSFVSIMSSLRISNFQYCGILVGTLDGATYDAGIKVSNSGISTQNRILNCYFTRGNDMSARDNVSAIMLTYPDNNVDNCITNRTRYGMTIRRGGNVVSNSHFTIQYATLPSVSNYNGANVRLWPFSSGDTQENAFSNCYFNAGKYVIYTYRDSSQTFTGANLRTMISNSHYTFYTSNVFEEIWNPVWYGGMWYGILTTTQCVLLYSDYTQLIPYLTTAAPSLRVALANEISFGTGTFPHTHTYLFDGANFNNNEWFCISNSSNGIPAGKYKRVAALVTRSPVGTFFMPGAIRYQISFGNGSVSIDGTIIRDQANGVYESTVNSEFSSTTMKMYISNDQQTITVDGITFYIAYIYVYAGSNVTDVRMMKIESDSPLVDVYAYVEPYNNDGSVTSTNQTIFTSVANLHEVF